MLQMHSYPRVIPLAPPSSRLEQVSVSPVGSARGEVKPEAGAITQVGNPKGSPPVSHHEYLVPLTVPLPMPATTSPSQEHSAEGELIRLSGIGATLEVNGVSAWENLEQNYTTHFMLNQFGIATTVCLDLVLVFAYGCSSPV